jgi:hypothetical protein
MEEGREKRETEKRRRKTGGLGDRETGRVVEEGKGKRETGNGETEKKDWETWVPGDWASGRKAKRRRKTGGLGDRERAIPKLYPERVKYQ